MNERVNENVSKKSGARSRDADATGSGDGPTAADEGVRLQKVLAAAGIASRRKAEEMILAGRVKVDGLQVRELGRRVDPENAVIHVDGSRITLGEHQVYLAVNKMSGVLSTMSDELGRPHLGEMVQDRTERLFHVGRLDQESEGLILLTNDGDLAHRLTHPSFGVSKTYMAEVPGPIPRDLGRRLKKGIELEDGPASVDEFEIVDQHNGRAVLRIVLHEGRKHIVRRMLDEAGHPVSRLVRTQVGEVQLGHQRPGTVRKLNAVEVALLYKAVGL